MSSVTIHLKNNGDQALIFDVGIVQDMYHTHHIVHVKKDDYVRITNKTCDAKELVKRSIDFLLTKETPDAILREFDLMDIKRYFPEYEEEMKKIM